jgi:hypothetical protein
VIVDHQEFLVSLEQLRELELALASVKRNAASSGAFHVQAASIQKEICRIRHDIDTYLGVADLHLSEPPDKVEHCQHRKL